MAESTVSRFEVEALEGQLGKLTNEVRACRFALRMMRHALEKHAPEVGARFMSDLRDAQNAFARDRENDLADALGKIAGDF